MANHGSDPQPLGEADGPVAGRRWPPEAGDYDDARPDRDGCDCRPPGAGLSRLEQGHRRHNRAFPECFQPGRSRFPLPVAGRRRLCSADRMHQRRQPAPGPHDRPAEGNRRARLAGSGPLARRRPAPDGKCPAGVGGRGAGGAAGHLGHRSGSRPDPGARLAQPGCPHRCAGARFHHRAFPADRHSVRPGASAAGLEGRPATGAEIRSGPAPPRLRGPGFWWCPRSLWQWCCWSAQG